MTFACAIAECTNTAKSKKLRGKDLIFHRFPYKNKSLCNVWIAKCKRKEKLNPINAAICCDHFTSSDYERDLENE